MKKIYSLLALSFLASVGYMPFVAHAQSLESLGGQAGGNISVRTIPARPGPNQPVTVTIESYATDLDRAVISWFLNNKLAAEAVGQKTFSFKTGGGGSLSSILIIVKTADGSTLQQSLDVRPASLDLIWEAEAYTPPFYKGKAFYPYEGTVKVVALPDIVTENGGTVNPKSLVYTWKVDGNAAPNVSGYGKNFILFKGAVPLRATSVEVEAASVDKMYAASGKTTFSPVLPQLMFYEDSPLYGVLYNEALGGNVTLANQEIKIAAVPYFIGVKERQDSEVVYKWQLNNQSVRLNGHKDSVAFRQDRGVSGSAVVSLDVSLLGKVFQLASGGLTLSFGDTSTASQF